jgi:hypothetical protein
MFDLLERCGQALAAQLQRSLVLGQIDLHNAVLYGHIHGEASPRVFENVTAVRLPYTLGLLVMQIEKTHISSLKNAQ